MNKRKREREGRGKGWEGGRKKTELDFQVWFFFLPTGRNQYQVIRIQR